MNEIIASLIGGFLTLVGSFTSVWWSRRPRIDIEYVDTNIIFTNSGLRPLRNFEIVDEIGEVLKKVSVVMPTEKIDIPNTLKSFYQYQWYDGIIRFKSITKNSAELKVMLYSLITASSGFVVSQSIPLYKLPNEIYKISKLPWSGTIEISLKEISDKTSMIKISNNEFYPYPITITVDANLYILRRVVSMSINADGTGSNNFSITSDHKHFYFMKSRWKTSIRSIENDSLAGLSTSDLFEILSRSEEKTHLDYSESFVDTGMGITHDWDSPRGRYSLHTAHYGIKKHEDSFGVAVFDKMSTIQSIASEDIFTKGFVAIILFDGRVCWIGDGTPGINELVTTKLKSEEVDQIKREIEYMSRVSGAKSTDEIRQLNFIK